VAMLKDLALTLSIAIAMFILHITFCHFIAGRRTRRETDMLVF
jgi:UDP-N-acetylglucosamine 2-epimerase